MITRHGRAYTSLRIRAETRRKLKLLASMRNKTQIDLVDELVTAELAILTRLNRMEEQVAQLPPPQKERP